MASDQQDSEDPYAVIGLNSASSGIPIEGYVEYDYEIGRKGRGPGQFGGWIQHYAISEDGKTLYACDLWNKRVQLINLENRRPVHAFPSNMAGFNFQARGIDVFRNGNLCINCVGFDGTSQIGIFSPEGQVISHFGKGIIGSSCAMTVDNLDRILVMDRRRVKISTLSKDGKLLESFDPKIDGDVLRMCCDSRGRIIVPDHLNNAVMVYESRGRPIYRINPIPGTGYDFKYPAGVTCDVDDNIIVCDVGHHRVTQFSNEGVYRATILSKRNHGLWHPHDVLATPQGNLVLSEVSSTFMKVFCFAPR